jgi:hypothetical protein
MEGEKSGHPEAPSEHGSLRDHDRGQQKSPAASRKGRLGDNNRNGRRSHSSSPDSSGIARDRQCRVRAVRGRTGHHFPESFRDGCQGFRGPAPSTLLDERRCLYVDIPHDMPRPGQCQRPGPLHLEEAVRERAAPGPSLSAGPGDGVLPDDADGAGLRGVPGTEAVRVGARRPAGRPHRDGVLARREGAVPAGLDVTAEQVVHG